MIGSRKTQASTSQNPEKKKKTHPAEWEPEVPRKQFKDSNFMPLNAPINEILMEVWRDPDYELPQKILREPLEKNKDKYCAYHNVMGHLTEGCIAL
jgi:hypothetical protein